MSSVNEATFLFWPSTATNFYQSWFVFSDYYTIVGVLHSSLLVMASTILKQLV